MHQEKRKRSILKAVTYRLVSILLDSTIAFLVTKSAQQTLILVFVSNAISIIIYFIHERTWNKIPWGRHKAKGCKCQLY
jgi:uncharacterized membrane protein